MPRLWTETIDAHREAVRDRTLERTAALVAELGLRAVTMSRIAEETGIGRATLYKYYPDVESILVAWHERQVDRHLAQVVEARDRADDPWERLETVAETYAFILRHLGGHDTDLIALLHRDEQVGRTRRRMHDVLRDVLVEAATAGRVRTDIDPDELATYCLHALAAAGSLDSRAAVRRLVAVTLAGLHPAS